MNCPICTTQMKITRYASTDYCDDEIYHTCLDGCCLYSYEYLYGSTRIIINDLDFFYHYTDKIEYVQETNKKIKDEIDKLKGNIIGLYDV